MRNVKILLLKGLKEVKYYKARYLTEMGQSINYRD